MGKPNPQNLKPFNTLTKEEQRKIATMGGEASARSRSFKALLKQIGEELTTADSTINRKEYVARRLYEIAAKGNIKAMELIMKVTNELEESITLNVKQPRDLTPEEAAALAKKIEEEY